MNYLYRDEERPDIGTGRLVARQFRDIHTKYMRHTEILDRFRAYGFQPAAGNDSHAAVLLSGKRGAYARSTG